MAMEAHFTSNPNISSPSHFLSLPAMLTSSHVHATNTVLLSPPIHHFSAHHRRGSSSLTTTTTAPLRSSRNRRRIGLKVEASIGPSTGNPVTKVLEKPTAVKATVTVQVSVGGFLSNLSLTRGLDDITDLLGKSILLELVSAELDPNTGKEKPTITAYAHKTKQDRDQVSYDADFAVPGGFGEIGAVIVENEHHTEMFLKGIVLTGYGDSPVNVVCNSWVHAKSDNSQKRVFFANKAYLPSQTPSGLRQLRQSELSTLRGNGQGERKVFERIYDYDVYNDLGDPDNNTELKRPVLGGKEHPYPRRCRTGRPMSKADPKSESRGSFWYVPRDESFSEIKQATFSIKTLRSVLHAVVPTLEATFLDPEFAYYTEIDKLFDEGVELPANTDVGFFKGLIPRLLKSIDDRADSLLLFETPEMIDRDKFAWFRDEEFSRQTLAGLNPLGLELVKEFPFVSKLDPTIYGPAESKITKEIIEREINTVMTVEEAIEQKKLFVLDYHDLLLPYVHKIRELKGTTLYGSRTVFFLMPNGTLKPLAIELTRPASPAKPQWSEVFTNCTDATGTWLWRLAKVHVCAHDSGIHQLVSHWLRTHCCMEPYIIAANRQLSAMHPIYRLLDPHFRYTMEINALAREALINAGGIIESCFSPLKYSMEICSVAYDKLWRFDAEALPADLIKRGMAEEDPTAEHGVKLTIKDYPYANDGLLVWSAIKEWVEEYVSHYYSNDDQVNSDREVQSWWTEVRTKGHADKKDEPWWPVVNTKANLCHVLTTIIWVASGHHAAVNFGQYHYAGYFPNRPTIARINMPCEEGNKAQFTRFLERPERILLETFPSQSQATKVMTILDVLSNHSIDEEYIGELPENSHPDDPAIKAAYEKFTGKLMEIEGIIDSRNLDRHLLNRHGAGVVPYELLKPLSEPGVTGRGIPNSISI